MSTKSRSQIIMPGDTVRLRVQFIGSDGTLTDLDAFPAITIIDPNGNVTVGPTSSGVFHESTGVYGFDFSVGVAPYIGTWRDLWQGTLTGFAVTSEFTFTVAQTEMPAIATDGYIHLGDDPGFSYSQIAIANINVLLKMLRARLNSRGFHRDTDDFGNAIHTECDIFNPDQLVSFLAYSLERFNETPTLTFFTFDDTPLMQQFGGIIVQGAVLSALSSQALIERGREMQINDNGTGFTPPTISELMNTQWSTELGNWQERLSAIKKDLKPSPQGLGTLRPLAAAPQFRRLRHLRERQIY